jgi:RNA polymerase sigma-54 factor
MAISQKLHTKLVQKLILTPSLQQAIKLLPMSTLELSELLNQEMVENPMLEEVPTEEQPQVSRPRRRLKRAAQKDGPGTTRTTSTSSGTTSTMGIVRARLPR